MGKAVKFGCGRAAQGSAHEESEEKNLLRGYERLHGILQCCLVVLEWDLSAGWHSELPPLDELAQGVHHGGQALLVCRGRRELSTSHVPCQNH